MTPSTLLSRNADTLTQRRQALLALAPAACLLLINYSSTLGTQDYLAALGILVGGRILLPLIFGGLGTGTLNPYVGIAAMALFALDNHKSLLPSDLALALAISAGSLALLVLNHLHQGFLFLSRVLGTPCGATPGRSNRSCRSFWACHRGPQHSVCPHAHASRTPREHCLSSPSSLAAWRYRRHWLCPAVPKLRPPFLPARCLHPDRPTTAKRS